MSLLTPIFLSLSFSASLDSGTPLAIPTEYRGEHIVFSLTPFHSHLHCIPLAHVLGVRDRGEIDFSGRIRGAPRGWRVGGGVPAGGFLDFVHILCAHLELGGEDAGGEGRDKSLRFGHEDLELALASSAQPVRIHLLIDGVVPDNNDNNNKR